MDRLMLMKTFIQVVESGSFSAAANALGSTQSHISKMIRMLEIQLNTTLFMRTTRSLTLTEEAHRLLPHAKTLIEGYNTALESVNGTQTEPKGHIRFLTSDGLGRMLFLPYLSGFFSRFPHITIEHIVTDRKVDLVENNIDLALRMGDLKDSTYKAKYIGLARRVTVASPEYIMKHGMPKTPQDLSHHNCIAFTRLSEYTGKGQAWEYHDSKTGENIRIPVSGRYSSDNSSTVRQAALSGLGIYQGPNWMFGEDTAKGHLMEILQDYQMDPFPIYLLHPLMDYLPLRLKALSDYLAHEFSLNPWVSK